jgi:hypothetical protein
MAKLEKIETTTYVYEYELSDDEYQQYLEDEDAFWSTFEENWELVEEDVDSIPTEINLLDE